ncbi:hypothetical protein BDZ85DRAFT_221467, partial [Elsinoe ampelina]
MNVLLTGSSGFLATHIHRLLADQHSDWTIHCLDIKPRVNSPEASPSYFPDEHFIAHPLPSTASALTALFQSLHLDGIIHCAGLIPSGPSRYNPSPALRKQVWQVNVEGTRNIISAAKEAGVKAVVYTSSCTVVADDLSQDFPLMREDDPPPPRENLLLYGQTKAAAEAIVLEANSWPPPTHQTPNPIKATPRQTPPPHNLLTCALRPAIIIGPDDPSPTLPTIFSLVATGQTPFVIGNGHNLIDFVAAENVAQAHILALENLLGAGRFDPSPADPSNDPLGRPAPSDWTPLPFSASGQAMFITNHAPIPFRSFLLAVFAQVGAHVPPYTLPIPARLAWFFGAVAEGVAWVTGRQGVLSRGSVMDATGTRYACAGDGRGRGGRWGRAERVLGYVPVVGLGEAVRAACEGYRGRLEGE